MVAFSNSTLPSASIRHPTPAPNKLLTKGTDSILPSDDINSPELDIKVSVIVKPAISPPVNCTFEPVISPECFTLN